MRFRSRTAAAGRLYAVTGTNTVSFAVVASETTAAGLLGFAVRRYDLAAGTDEWMQGFKVFHSLVPEPTPGESVSTYYQPVQSFTWDDFTCQPDSRYRYVFHPLEGTPDHLVRSATPLTLTIRTEPLYGERHDVFFNRGVASSQAYTRLYGDTPIADLDPDRRKQALGWLSRDLDDALLRFVDQTDPGDRLLGCFYEFTYLPAAAALKSAIDRGVDVHLIVDAKDNGSATEPAFPREENLATLASSGIPMDRVVLREARTSAIAHNKFMVHIPAGSVPTQVWTGSTNLTQGGIAGQTNVGHWVRDPAAALAFQGYWNLLSSDPGGRADDTRTEVLAKNAAYRSAVEQLSPVPADLHDAPVGVTPVFSPRQGTDVLMSYAALLDTAVREGCISFAFGVGAAFKELLKDNTAQNAIVFMLLEKRDRPDPSHPSAYVRINASNNVYEAWGSYLDNPVYQWAKETNAALLGLNSHVSYVHSKFMLIDPLGDDPVVVTGSANFSNASTTDNDENMIIVRGDRRAADIYYTEFNRIFNHYYFRSVTEATAGEPQSALDASLFLAEDDSWEQKYRAGSLKAKRLALYEAMSGFTRA
ncbi:MAG TPA: phospholipase D-like domain-containing protein [Nocardioides sp.]|uniref:phospholipase D-like domain-containing protein n=1 Tax=Nocardioides sp. TaxID=35761 RepID=UPI002F41C8EE